MHNTQTMLLELSKQAENLAEFLEKACKIIDISFRKASLQAGLSHGTIWSIVSNKVKHGDKETVARLAVYFKVPEINLLRLAGYTPRYVTPTHLLEDAEGIYQVLTNGEKEEWIKYGRLLVQARGPDLVTDQEERRHAPP